MDIWSMGLFVGGSIVTLATTLTVLKVKQEGFETKLHDLETTNKTNVDLAVAVAMQESSAEYIKNTVTMVDSFTNAINKTIELQMEYKEGFTRVHGRIDAQNKELREHQLAMQRDFVSKDTCNATHVKSRRANV